MERSHEGRVLWVDVDGLDGAPICSRPVTAAIGTFDGVHRAHVALLKLALETAGGTGCAVALTFEPPPMEFLSRGASSGFPGTRLTTLEEKVELLLGAGVDEVWILRFDRRLADMSGRRFVERVLRRGLGVRRCVVGFNFTFGAGGKNGPQELIRYAGPLGMKVKVVEQICIDGMAVSSTAVREALMEGDAASAAAMLGRPYAIRGEVVRGDGRGRKLGFPTANLRVDPCKLVPRAGVYAVRAALPDSRPPRPGLFYVGSRPTFGGGGTRMELHLADGGEYNLLGSVLEVRLLEFLRCERRFASAAELVAAMERDRRRLAEVLEWEKVGTDGAEDCGLRAVEECGGALQETGGG